MTSRPRRIRRHLREDDVSGDRHQARGRRRRRHRSRRVARRPSRASGCAPVTSCTSPATARRHRSTRERSRGSVAHCQRCSTTRRSGSRVLRRRQAARPDRLRRPGHARRAHRPPAARAARSCKAGKGINVPDTDSAHLGADRQGPRRPGDRGRDRGPGAAVVRPVPVRRRAACSTNWTGSATTGWASCSRSRPGEAFERLPQLLLTAMRRRRVGVMIARGDLAVEMRLRANGRSAGGDPVAVRGRAPAGDLGDPGARAARQDRAYRRAPRSATPQWASAPSA